MSTLTDFLLARIAEDEDAAREGVRGSTWVDFWGGVVVAGGDETVASCKLEDLALIGSEGYTYPPNPDDIATAAHIARHDPARVLAECEAKRQIVEAFLDAERAIATYDHAHPTDAYWQEWGNRHALALAVELLARAYSDHPDYAEATR